MAAIATDKKLYGLMARFETPEALIEATKKIRQAGYQKVEAYSPFPIEEMAEIIGYRKTRLPVLIFIGGLLGGLGGFLMQYYASVISYPLNIGGRPLNSWVSFIPIIFELTVLGAALTAVFGMFTLNGLPLPYHAVFNTRRFDEASRDQFFLCVEADDRQFDLTKTKAHLADLNPKDVSEVLP